MPKVVEKRLTVLQVKNLKKPGRHADGGGLYLTVKESGSKSWTFRATVNGRVRSFGLGPARDVALADARSKAAAMRNAVQEGKDPADVLERNKPTIPTFEEAANAFLAERNQSWGNAKHRQQWPNTLRDYVYPKIGKKPVDAIQSGDILDVLIPIWMKKPETARRVRQRMRTIFDWAIARHYRESINPVDAVRAALPQQLDRKRHFPSLPYDEVPAFIKALHGSKASFHVRLAFEFLIQTAARTGEVLGARWDEIDDDVWTVPAERMKAGAEHRVPLSDRCVEILNEASVFRRAEIIFPGRRWDRPMSNMAFTMTLRRMGFDHITVHGFRSSFRDWAADRTNFQRDVCEAALAHTVRDKVEAAYRRTDLFEKRRELMDLWSRFLTETAAEVITINR